MVSVSEKAFCLSEHECKWHLSLSCLQVDEQMTFGLVKNKLKENFAKLAGFRLTLIAGKVVPLDTATLQAHKITSDGCVIFVLATPQGTYPEHNKNSVNGRYVPAKELSIKQVPPEEAIQLLDQLEVILHPASVVDALKKSSDYSGTFFITLRTVL